MMGLMWWFWFKPLYIETLVTQGLQLTFSCFTSYFLRSFFSPQRFLPCRFLLLFGSLPCGTVVHSVISFLEPKKSCWQLFYLLTWYCKEVMLLTSFNNKLDSRSLFCILFIITMDKKKVSILTRSWCWCYYHLQESEAYMIPRKIGVCRLHHIWKGQ